MVQVDNDPKTVKPSQEFLKAKKRDILQRPSQSPNVDPTKRVFSLLNKKPECSNEALVDNLSGESTTSGDVHVF